MRRDLPQMTGGWCLAARECFCGGSQLWVIFRLESLPLSQPKHGGSARQLMETSQFEQRDRVLAGEEEGQCM